MDIHFWRVDTISYKSSLNFGSVCLKSVWLIQIIFSWKIKLGIILWLVTYLFFSLNRDINICNWSFKIVIRFCATLLMIDRASLLHWWLSLLTLHFEGSCKSLRWFHLSLRLKPICIIHWGFWSLNWKVFNISFWLRLVLNLWQWFILIRCLKFRFGRFSSIWIKFNIIPFRLKLFKWKLLLFFCRRHVQIMLRLNVKRVYLKRLRWWSCRKPYRYRVWFWFPWHSAFIYCNSTLTFSLFHTCSHTHWSWSLPFLMPWRVFLFIILHLRLLRKMDRKFTWCPVIIRFDKLSSSPFIWFLISNYSHFEVEAVLHLSNYLVFIYRLFRLLIVLPFDDLWFFLRLKAWVHRPLTIISVICGSWPLFHRNHLWSDHFICIFGVFKPDSVLLFLICLLMLAKLLFIIKLWNILFTGGFNCTLKFSFW